MSSATISPGCIFHWEEYQFDDGEKANKYFVILGAKQGSNYLAVIATSKQRKRKFEAGCHAKDGYYHIPGGGKDWFPKDTWLLLAPPVEITAADFLRLSLVEKKVELKGNLRTDTANAIKNCLRQCQDVSEEQIGLL